MPRIKALHVLQLMDTTAANIASRIPTKDACIAGQED
jgi:hypothetical protein